MSKYNKKVRWFEFLIWRREGILLEFKSKSGETYGLVETGSRRIKEVPIKKLKFID